MEPLPGSKYRTFPAVLEGSLALLARPHPHAKDNCYSGFTIID